MQRQKLLPNYSTSSPIQSPNSLTKLVHYLLSLTGVLHVCKNSFLPKHIKWEQRSSDVQCLQYYCYILPEDLCIKQLVSVNEQITFILKSTCFLNNIHMVCGQLPVSCELQKLITNTCRNLKMNL